jgi:transient receptor potential cation channel subfamily M member 2
MPKNKNINSNLDALLDPNHTHFILVDDGTEGQFGGEIQFRAQLEAELRKGKSLKYYDEKFKRKVCILKEDKEIEEKSSKEIIPMVLIVVQGGPNTLLTVEKALIEDVPVLILAVIKFELCLFFFYVF